MGRPAEVVREAMKIIWSDGDVSRVNEFYAENFQADYPVTDWGTGLAGVSALATQVRKDLPGYTEHIDELIEAGDEVVVRLTITGNHPETNADISFKDVTILTVKNGKIVRQRGLTDYLSLYRQLGLIEVPS